MIVTINLPGILLPRATGICTIFITLRPTSPGTIVRTIVTKVPAEQRESGLKCCQMTSDPNHTEPCYRGMVSVVPRAPADYSSTIDPGEHAKVVFLYILHIRFML